MTTFDPSHRAFGRKPADSAVQKWATIAAYATRWCGGREAEGGFVFPDAQSKQQFDIWYAENAPAGLTVRSRVVTRVAPEPNAAPAPAVAPQFNTIRDLRMWHWRQVLAQRAEQRKFEELLATAKTDMKALNFAHIAGSARMQASLHQAAVDVLSNAMFGNSTAEQDCAEEDAKGTKP